MCIISTPHHVLLEQLASTSRLILSVLIPTGANQYQSGTVNNINGSTRPAVFHGNRYTASAVDNVHSTSRPDGSARRLSW